MKTAKIRFLPGLVEKIEPLREEIVNQLKQLKINSYLKDKYPIGSLARILAEAQGKYGASTFGNPMSSLDERIAKELGLLDSPTDVSNPGGLLDGYHKSKE